MAVSCLCYNWMPADDWSRTSVDIRERGGARVTAFDLAEVRSAVMGRTGSGKVPCPQAERSKIVKLSGNVHTEVVTPPDDLWKNLEYFLRKASVCVCVCVCVYVRERCVWDRER